MEPITPERFEEALAKALREGDPRVGLFGPHSKVWEVNRYSLIFFRNSENKKRKGKRIETNGKRKKG